MNKHIWYRLEYKEYANYCTQYFAAFGIVALFSIIWNLVDYQGVPGIVASSLTSAICIFCLILGYVFRYVDKHEWELTQNNKGGKTK